MATTLKESSRTPGRRKGLLRQTLSVAQIALSLVLRVGAGLLLRTLRNLLGANLGFDPRNVLLMSVDLSLEGYPEGRARQFYRQVVERATPLPGVRAASWAATAPLSGLHIAFDLIFDDQRLGGEQTVHVDGSASRRGQAARPCKESWC